jgi:hypothetical protein
VQDAAAVRERDRVAHLEEDLEEIGQKVRVEARRAGPVQRVLERLALNELHADETRAALVATELVNGHDVRMFELPGDARFLHEASHVGVAHRFLGRQHLDGDVALELPIVSSNHRPHTPATYELAFDVAVGDEERLRRGNAAHAMGAGHDGGERDIFLQGGDVGRRRVVGGYERLVVVGGGHGHAEAVRCSTWRSRSASCGCEHDSPSHR